MYQGQMTVRPHKFTEEVRTRYLDLLRAGHGRFFSARTVGVHPETVRRFYRASAEFRDQVAESELEGIEPIQARLMQAALDGEPWAVKMVLESRDRARWGAEKGGTVNVNVAAGGDVAVAVGAGRLGAVVELRRQLEERATLGITQDLPALEQGREIVEAEIVEG